MNMFFGLVLHMYAFFFINFSFARFFLYALCHPPPLLTFIMVPLLKIIIIFHSQSAVFFFSQLAFCQLKTLQMLKTNHMYISSQHLLITLEDVALQC